MLAAAFDFKLDHEVKGQLVTIGKFDGVYPSMAIATSGGKVLIHSPYMSSQDTGEFKQVGAQSLGIAANLAQEKPEESGQVRFLNTNKDIVALECGQLDPGKPNQLLFIGSQTNLLVYDVEQNADVFDYEVADGLNCLAFGKMRGIKEPLIVAGGDCAITGFDMHAEEKFWTVTGDNARTMKFLPWQNIDAQCELVVGSDDFAIRVFKGAELIFDINEDAKVLDMQVIQKNVFGYALENGTYGVYYSRKRLWRQSQSAKVTSIAGMDFNLDGQMCLAIGFDNGLVEVRKHRTGDLVCQAELSPQVANGKPNAVSKLFYYDYRMQGNKQLIAVGQDGLIQGYTVTVSTAQIEAQVQGEDKLTSNEVLGLNKKKIELINKLSELEEKKKQLAKNPQQAAQMTAAAPPQDNEVEITVVPHIENKKINLNIKLQKAGWIVRSVILFSDILFTGGSFAVHPSESVSQVQVPIVHAKNAAETIELKILIGAGINAPFFLCHTVPSFELPSFAFYAPLTTSALQDRFVMSESHVVFTMRDTSFDAVTSWLSSTFRIKEDSYAIQQMDQQLTARFVDARSHDSLILRFTRQADYSTFQVRVMTEDIEAAADLVQNLAGAFSENELTSTCQFSRMEEKLSEIINTVEQSNTLKTHFAANIAENIQNVKVFTVRAEASLMIDDLDGLKKNYAQVQQENTALINEYRKRQNNHDELLASLKSMNTLIRKASNLRVGKANKQVVAHARACIKANQFAKILPIFKSGAAPQ